MADDLHRACAEAMHRIQWRLEKRYRREQERFVELRDSDTVASITDGFAESEWDLLLGKLSADERRIVLKIVVDGLTEVEVARQMHWSLARIHRTKKRALMALRKMLDE